MAHNFLEQLVAEWYEYQGYFVRRNVFVGPLQTGGYECELDVVAFDPKSRRIVHIEPSMDAQSWSQRAVRYDRKFACGRKYIPALFHGLKSHAQIEQIALFVFASTKVHKSIAGGRVMLLPELLQTIFLSLKDKTIARAAVPEQYPLIRTLQLVSDYRHLVFDASHPSAEEE